ncbi:MAG: proline racemase family protein [Bacteroidota bacterium]
MKKNSADVWQRIIASPSFIAPSHCRAIRSIDLHTEGEPLRVIVGGFPELEGNSILDYRAFVRDHWDELRRALMWEPRGHADMYGCLLTPPVSPEADFGTFFLHNEGYSTMCGHAIIALATLAVKMDWVDADQAVINLNIDTPAGLVWTSVRRKAGKIEKVSFVNVDSYVYAKDCQVVVPGLGTVPYDLAFGGAYYAYVPAEAIGLSLEASNVSEIIRLGKAIKRAVIKSHPIEHPEPERAEIGFLYGTIFVGPAENPAHHSRNVCVFAEGEVDRSPTGTGVSGRVALHAARGELTIGEEITIESILGTTFDVKIKKESRFAGIPAVIPEVSGRAFITGQHEFLLDPEDPLRNGFLLR